MSCSLLLISLCTIILLSVFVLSDYCIVGADGCVLLHHIVVVADGCVLLHRIVVCG